MPRPTDKLRIELVGGSGSGSAFDIFTSFEVVNDITTAFEASFEFGNDGTWESVKDYITLGSQYKVFQNDLLRLTGRVEMSDIPEDATAGSVCRFVVRTKIADALFSGADPGVKVKKTSVKDFLLALYAPLGYTESDFEFKANVARDLMTGVSTDGQGEPKKVDLEPMKVEDAKVQATESIFAAADRHLRRFGLMHWDSPDGKIVVSAPNDTQPPLYFLRCLRGKKGAQNNILSCTRTQDYSDIPSQITVHGRSGGKPRKKLKGVATDDDVTAAGFHRPVVMAAEEFKIQSLVDRSAARELSARSRRKDCFDILSDSLSWWDGYKNIPWATDTVCNIETDNAGGALGNYYIHRVALRCDANGGNTTNLSILRSGIWRI